MAPVVSNEEEEPSLLAQRLTHPKNSFLQRSAYCVAIRQHTVIVTGSPTGDTCSQKTEQIAKIGADGMWRRPRRAGPAGADRPSRPHIYCLGESSPRESPWRNLKNVINQTPSFEMDLATTH